MVIVSDTSPLNYLILVDAIETTLRSQCAPFIANNIYFFAPLSRASSALMLASWGLMSLRGR